MRARYDSDFRTRLNDYEKSADMHAVFLDGRSEIKLQSLPDNVWDATEIKAGAITSFFWDSSLLKLPGPIQFEFDPSGAVIADLINDFQGDNLNMLAVNGPTVSAIRRATIWLASNPKRELHIGVTGASADDGENSSQTAFYSSSGKGNTSVTDKGALESWKQAIKLYGRDDGHNNLNRIKLFKDVLRGRPQLRFNGKTSVGSGKSPRKGRQRVKTPKF